MSVERPVVPSDRLDAGGWTEVERSLETPFDAGIVSVEANTVVYEDDRLRARIREATGTDCQWRFFLAGRLALTPRTPPSGPLTRLFANRTHEAFADRLSERGLDGVRRAGTERRRVDDRVARVATFEALRRLDEFSVVVAAEVSVRPNDREYVVAGGAYPRRLRDGIDGESAPDVTRHLDRDAFAAELRDLMAAVE
jgi:hypothetical protein